MRSRKGEPHPGECDASDVRSRSDGDARAACRFTPTGAGPGSPRPLLVFLHGSGGSASAIYDATSLRAKAAGFDLSGDPARPGFALVADQGRNIRSANGNAPAARHDIYFRDLADHPDVRALDRLIDAAVDSGAVDPDRIYLTGWSNGAFFAQLYGLLRHAQPTTGRARVAAVAVFDGADPYAEPTAGAPECAFRPLPTSTLPVLIAHRACSIVPCDAAQATVLAAPPGYDVGAWLDTLAATVGATDVTGILVAGDGSTVTACTAAASCTRALATLNHIRWPDGVADGSGIDHEVEMLGYLRDHPLR